MAARKIRTGRPKGPEKTRLHPRLEEGEFVELEALWQRARQAGVADTQSVHSWVSAWLLPMARRVVEGDRMDPETEALADRAVALLKDELPAADRRFVLRAALGKLVRGLEVHGPAYIVGFEKGAK